MRLSLKTGRFIDNGNQKHLLARKNENCLHVELLFMT